MVPASFYVLPVPPIGHEGRKTGPSQWLLLKIPQGSLRTLFALPLALAPGVSVTQVFWVNPEWAAWEFLLAWFLLTIHFSILQKS